MAAGNFSACVVVTLAYEGGLSTIRSDAGNWTSGKVGVGTLKGTNFGIAASSHPTLDIVHLTKADAEAIYQREYWAPNGCEALPAGLDLMHFDGCVNSGAGYARGWLGKAQAASGGTAGEVHAYAAARLSSLHSFKAWATFGKGWAARVADVEAKSLKMALAGTQLSPAAASAVIAAQASTSATTAKVAATTATASATIGVLATATAAQAHPAVAGGIALFSLISWLVAAFRAHGAGVRAAVLTSAAKTA